MTGPTGATSPAVAGVPFVATPEQQAAIEHPASPLLVVAGAGTGKTSVMAERILHLVLSNQAAAHEIVGLTFTNKAAANLHQRVTDRLGTDADVTIATYHSFGAALVADHALELDLHPHTQILNRAQAWQLLYAVFDEFRFDKRSTYVPRVVVDDALQLASRCADHLVSIDDVAADCHEVMEHGRWQKQREAAAKRLELCQVVAAYDRRKRDRNLLDYGDQITLAVRLLRNHPDLAERLRHERPVVLLDEYQDTNYAQRVLLQLIYPPGSAITAVGDDMQSIYGFRGAHLGNILSFDQHFPPATRRPLEINRRSGEAVVELANRIQAQVSQAHPKSLVALDGAPPTTIECFAAADDAAEAAEIAREIAALGAPWRDHAILCRKRRIIPAIVDALEAADLPVEVAGAGGLLERPEVVDVVAWLEVLADPDTSVALLRILRGPRFRLGFRDLASLARHSRALSDRDANQRATLADALDDLASVADLSTAARARVQQFLAERARLGQLARQLSVLDLSEAIAHQTALWSATDARGRENLLRFFDLAARFEPIDGEPGLAAFVDYLRLMDEAEEDVAEAHLGELDAVRVMTVHQAKGLEFPNVWVPGLAGGAGRGAGVFPDSRMAENGMSQGSALPWWVRPDDDGLPHWRDVQKESELTDELRVRRSDEEWRLFYVACTRAQRRLVLSTAQWYPGPASPQGPSPFYRFVAEQTDLVTERFHHEATDIDPATAARERRRAVAAARAQPEGAMTGQQQALFSPAAIDEARHIRTRRPETLSVSGLVDYARCRRQFYWSSVRPLPRRPRAAAALGTAVHRWIEQRAETTTTTTTTATSPARAESPTPTSSGRQAALRAAFLASPYAPLVPDKVEAPFELVVGNVVIRGRIDAVYHDGDVIDLVDFKTGSSPEPGDASAGRQLALYALAAADTWDADPSSIRTTYCWLRPEGHVLESREWSPTALDEVRAALHADLAALASAHYDARPGSWCRSCDFLAFCPAGQAANS